MKPSLLMQLQVPHLLNVTAFAAAAAAAAVAGAAAAA
jgi:hypothetical protein